MTIYADKVFKDPVKTLLAFNAKEFAEAFEQIERYKDTHFLLGYIRYEARDVFAGRDVESPLPLLYFEVFEGFEAYTPKAAPRPFALNPKPAIDFDAYARALREIREEIARGNTYEVNYTYDFDVASPDAEPLALYEYLLTRQKTPYNMFMQNEYDTLLSFSPELFFEMTRNDTSSWHIRTKPMKGTVQRGQTGEEDAQLIEFLKNDIKNRAENVMIVDLLRNDLGRIAKTGSVRVSKLFEIETHPTLHQMTSEIEADLKEGTSLYAVFKAIFPCGSITGAPKISTMNIIDRVETGRRNIYCGAIGFISPGRMTFSVPIRILQKSRKGEPVGSAGFTYRVGGAIVWDSDIEDEWQETLTKTRFLTAGFQLIETMKVENGVMLFQQEHWDRLRNSAAHFGFTLDPALFNLRPDRDGILRLVVEKDGRYMVEYRDLTPDQRDTIRISPLTVNSGDFFLYHKTSFRPYFQVNYADFYDEVFFNEKGELTEGSRTNIVLEIEGKKYTPPLSCGLLNGVYRQHMLAGGQCTERILYKEDLLRAEAVYCVNSVRGIKKVVLT
jgi:para-aminobenzoate synthetase/4-amino-4-deoxychorismate lyase